MAISVDPIREDIARIRNMEAHVRSRTKRQTKYQIFISSTFTDLRDQRQAVSRAVLELGHFPAGMELFPAFDQSQLEFIKRVIDDCDYYLIIIGGKYGSLTAEGVSFTEAEYDYAVEKEKPVIALLHNDIGKLASENVESDAVARDKLEKFRKKLQSGRLIKFWSDINDLKSNAIISLTAAIDQKPQTGWRRDDGLDASAAMVRLERYRDELEGFRRRYHEARQRLADYENIDTAEVDVKWRGADGPHISGVDADDIIREFAAPLKNGFKKESVGDRLLSLINHRVDETASEINAESVENILLFLEVFEIAAVDETGDYKIRDEKIPLLKSAFRRRVRQTQVKEDEIPF